MSDTKDSESFFRKVVRFVANPTTDWAELSSRHGRDARETELERSELKAMIERKRRNDFVRKREFDMLRKVRREGLSADQMGAIGGSSRIDDSEVRVSETAVVSKQSGGVKAKIDAIEQQMVGTAGFSPPPRRQPPNSPSLEAPTLPPPVPLAPLRPVATAPGALAPASPTQSAGPGPIDPPRLSPLSAVPISGHSDLHSDLGSPMAVEVNEVVHDPDLDEAVIAFANADFEQCEHALTDLMHGSRAQHAETWLVLFDLYRAIGQHTKFENLALHYAQQFGWSAPQWFSMPKLVAEASAEDHQKKPAVATRHSGEIGWLCPDRLDLEAVNQLRSQSLQLPVPWVFDWSDLRSIDADACSKLSELFRQWAKEPIDMRWMGGEQLFTTLQDAAPTGVRDADPVYWTLRLDALRLANRPDQFDEAAIDYCVTYEVSPPSWERAKCTVRISGGSTSTQSPPMSVLGEVHTSFMESVFDGGGNSSDGPASVEVAAVELSGQLVGDIAPTLKKLDGELGQAAIVNVSCAKLIRVDFIAAGDLLNWVLARRGENRSVNFIQAHRLVALFFGAMGINEHAKVKVSTV